MNMNEKWLYIIRHGETDYNKNRIVQGSGVDSSLNETGRNQSISFYEKYQYHPFELVVCSSLQRTYQTIKPFLDHNIPLERYSEINEINWGIHEGQKSDPWLIQNYQSVVSQWNAGQYDASIEKGESAAALARRIQMFLELIKQKEEKNILICSHGRTLRCMMCLINKEPVRNMDKYQHSNTGLYLVKQKGSDFVIEMANDTGHLKIQANQWS